MNENRHYSDDGKVEWAARGFTSQQQPQSQSHHSFPSNGWLIANNQQQSTYSTAQRLGTETVSMQPATATAPEDKTQNKDLYRPKPPLDLSPLRWITTLFVVIIAIVSLLDILFTVFWAVEAVRQYFPSYYVGDFGTQYNFNGEYSIMNMLHGSESTAVCSIATSVSTVVGGNITLNQFQSNPNCPFSNCIVDNYCSLSTAFNATQYGLSSIYNTMFANATATASTCRTVNETAFMALRCEFTDLFDSQKYMSSCILFNSSSTSTSWAYTNQQQLEQMVAYSAVSMKSWASLRYCAVRYSGSRQFLPLPARRRLQLGRDVPVDLRVMMVMVLVASVITVFFHYMKAYLVLLSYCTKGARSPRVVVWTSSSPLWIAMLSSEVYRTLITMSYQKAGLIQLAVFDTVFNVFPHLASLLYLYYAMPDFPSTAVWKTSTVLAILVFDIIVVILSYTLLNIENRRRWNEEQIENEAFTHDYLVEKENDSKQNAVQAKESQQQQDEHQLYDQL